jgi:hypothetical protein
VRVAEPLRLVACEYVQTMIPELGPGPRAPGAVWSRRTVACSGPEACWAVGGLRCAGLPSPFVWRLVSVSRPCSRDASFKATPVYHRGGESDRLECFESTFESCFERSNVEQKYTHNLLVTQIVSESASLLKRIYLFFFDGSNAEEWRRVATKVGEHCHSTIQS